MLLARTAQTEYHPGFTPAQSLRMVLALWEARYDQDRPEGQAVCALCFTLAPDFIAVHNEIRPRVCPREMTLEPCDSRNLGRGWRSGALSNQTPLGEEVGGALSLVAGAPNAEL